ncbi:MAG: caspase family protein [Brasilonema angustatum HA4187-MV1]|jgi:WD40 repeat protein|nr:caspase family protein [Brasilonema angustatum HA4187-MV1]
MSQTNTLPNAQNRTGFKRSLAIVIGINEYQNKIPNLQTARNDAEKLAEILAKEHQYNEVILITDKTDCKPTLQNLSTLLKEIRLTKDDRLLFYFAGHGIARDSDKGPAGYLVPQNADLEKNENLLSMQKLHDCLSALSCRHLLVILDCCFAGTFRWSTARLATVIPTVICQEHYDRFIKSPAWQAITSAAHNQEALDIIRLRDNRGGDKHSPFAKALFDALRGEGDIYPPAKNGKSAGDGVITARELHIYLEGNVAKDSNGSQTPGIWTLSKHDSGEYIFLVPGAELKLKHAPNLIEENNPYRGLQSFEEEHSQLFFGRKQLVEELYKKVSNASSWLTVVLGVSGSGKSSLVKAGLIPDLRKQDKKWHVLNPMRPTESPFTALARTLLQITNNNDIFVSDQLDSLQLVDKILQQEITVLNKEIDDCDRNSEEDEIFRLKQKVEKYEKFVEIWKRETKETKQRLIVDYFEEINIVVSQKLENLYSIVQIIQTKIKSLNKTIYDCDKNHNSIKKYEKYIDILNRGFKEKSPNFILSYFEELNNLCSDEYLKRKRNMPFGHAPQTQESDFSFFGVDQLKNEQEAVLDCLNPLSKRLQEDSNKFIEIVKTWSQKNSDKRLLLVIDQFEELITLSSQSKEDKQNKQPNLTESQQFLKLLEETLAAKLPQLSIVVTLRSDFEPRFLNSEVLKSYWADARFPVRAMYSNELREAIERPAAEKALYFEQLPDQRNPVDRLIDEVGQMPGALPLLSFTLSELYIKLAKKWIPGGSSDRALKLDAEFDKAGGVAGSLTRRANQEYQDLPDDAHKDTMRRMMLRMVTVENGESARRPVPLSELVYAHKDDPSKPDDEENQRVKFVKKCLIDARLIVSGQLKMGEPYVEPAHDFLVKSWDKLLEWQKEQDLPLQRRLTPNALDWKKQKPSASILGKAEPVLSWFDKKIDSGEDWFEEHSPSILGKAEPVLSWFDKKIHSAEDWFNKIKKNAQKHQTNKDAEEPQTNKDAQERQREKKTQFLWNGNPYLDVLRKKLKSLESKDYYWFNQVETEFVQRSIWQRRRNVNLRWSIAIGIILLSSGLTIWALSGQKQALIKQMSADKNSTETMLRTNELTLDTFISSLRAGKSLNNWLFWVGFLKPQLNEQLQSQVIETLRTASYAVREQNRWQLRPGWIARDIVIDENKILVAATTNDNNICVWNIQSDEKPLCHEFSDNQSLLASPMLKFSPDNKKLVISDSDSVKPTEIVLWNLESDQIQKLKGDFVPDGYSFSPDSRKLAFIKDKTVYLWDGENTPELYPLEELQGDVKGINFKPDGNLLVATAIEEQDSPTLVHVLDCSSGEEKKYTFPDLNKVINIIIGNNGQPLYITSFYGLGMADVPYIYLWKRSEEKLQRLDFDEKVSFSPDGKQLVITQSDGTIQLLNSDSSEEQLTIQGHQGIFSNVSFTRNGKQLLTASNDGTISLWNLEQKLIDPTAAIDFPDLIDGFNFSQDGQQLVTLKAGTVHLWDLSSIQELSLPSLLQQQQYDKESKFILSPNGNQSTQLAILEPIDNKSQKIHVWDLSLGKEQVYPINNHSFNNNKFELGRFSPDGKQLAILYKYDSIYLLNLTKNDNNKKLTCKAKDIYALAWTTDGRLVAATLGQDSIDIWELSPDSSCYEKQLASQRFGDEFPRDFRNSNHNISFNTDGSLVNISYQAHIILWDWRRNLLVKFDQDTDGYNLISPDGRTLVSLLNSNEDQTNNEDQTKFQIKLWRLGGLDELLKSGCERVRDYLTTLDENNSDRHLCDNVPSAPVNPDK